MLRDLEVLDRRIFSKYFKLKTQNKKFGSMQRDQVTRNTSTRSTDVPACTKKSLFQLIAVMARVVT